MVLVVPRLKMLEELNKTDWEKLKFPGMPKLILSLASTDDKLREQAYDELYDGGIPELTYATPYIIPFLVKLLRLPNVKQKYSILLLLTQICGNAMAYVTQTHSASAHNIVREITKGIDLYPMFLDDEDTADIAAQLLDYLNAYKNLVAM